MRARNGTMKGKLLQRGVGWECPFVVSKDPFKYLLPQEKGVVHKHTRARPHTPQRGLLPSWLVVCSCTIFRKISVDIDMQENTWARLRDSRPGVQHAIHATYPTNFLAFLYHHSTNPPIILGRKLGFIVA